VACGVVGFGFTALQDVGDWVTFSDHSLVQLGVYAGKGIGFDFVHAAACLVFALAFGPALIRSLSRFAARLQVTWGPVGGAGERRAGGGGAGERRAGGGGAGERRAGGGGADARPAGAGAAGPRGAGAGAVVVLVIAAWLAGQPGVGGGAARAAVRGLARAAAPCTCITAHSIPRRESVSVYARGTCTSAHGPRGARDMRGYAGLPTPAHATIATATTPATYLRSAQNPDGGFGSAPGQSSSSLFSGWAALGLAAAGQNAQDVVRSGHSLIDYIGATAGSASDPGSIERTILVVHAAGLSPTRFAGRNLVRVLQADIRPNGSVSGQVNLTAFAVLALRAAGVGVPPVTLSWLERQQDADGGFSFATRGGSSDVDDTGSALEALAGAGASSAARARTRAIHFLRTQQNADGGFPSQPGTDSNAQSTAFAVQGLLAAGVDPNSLRRRGGSPLDYLRSLIAADGHVRYARSADQTPVWVTAQALMALAGKPLPLAPAARRTQPAPAQHPARSATARTSPRRTPAVARKAHPSVRHKQAHIAATPAPRATRSPLDSLAVDAGVLTALMLAPLGQG
jgi:prenyltransferase beta subunit